MNYDTQNPDGRLGTNDETTRKTPSQFTSDVIESKNIVSVRRFYLIFKNINVAIVTSLNDLSTGSFSRFPQGMITVVLLMRMARRIVRAKMTKLNLGSSLESNHPSSYRFFSQMLLNSFLYKVATNTLSPFLTGEKFMVGRLTRCLFERYFPRRNANFFYICIYRGYGKAGRYGTGDTTYTTPIEMTLNRGALGGKTVTSFCAGPGHSLYITTEKKLVATVCVLQIVENVADDSKSITFLVFQQGMNECGELGDGTRNNRSGPTAININTGGSVLLDVACGRYHVLSRCIHFSVLSLFPLLLSKGMYHSLALTEDGKGKSTPWIIHSSWVII